MTVALNTLSARSAVAQAAAPQWLKDWQQQGQDDFAALAWPTRKTEAWKYTPLKALLDVTWQKSTESTDEPGIRFENWNDIRIDLVIGQRVPVLAQKFHGPDEILGLLSVQRPRHDALVIDVLPGAQCIRGRQHGGPDHVQRRRGPLVKARP